MSKELFSNQRVGVFLDVQSMYFACRDFAEDDSAKLEYSRVLEEVVEDRILVRATAYLRYYRESDIHGFHQALNLKGFEVQSKPSKDHNGKPLDWVVGVTLDILANREKIDTAILITHDDGFVQALPRLSNLGVPVEVWGFESGMDSALKQAAAKFRFLSEDTLIKKRD